MSTIADWERGRFETEAAADIAALPITFESPAVEVFDVEFDNPPEVECLRSRLTAGLGVQLLVAGTETFITVTLNGETETFQVRSDRANDAFEHPYAYGATLPL